MADFSHQPSPIPGAPPRLQPIRSEGDLTHQVQGPLGPMTVVPDNYAGPMPANAVRQSDYARMTHVYGDIASGHSSVQFDTSNFFQTEDGNDISLLSDPKAYLKAIGDAATFKQQYMDYLRDLVKTPAGLQLLETLDTSKQATTIKHTVGGNYAKPEDSDVGKAYMNTDGTRGSGSSSIVNVDPLATEWDGETCDQAVKPWMADRPRWGFYHELVHAYHFNQGEAALDGHGHAQCVKEYPHEMQNEEWQTAGLGPYAGRSVSENAIRAQMGVPLRETYSGMKYDGPDYWGQQTDAEEPPRKSPRR